MLSSFRLDNHDIVGMREVQDCPGPLVQHVRIEMLGTQKRDISLKLRPNRFKALEFAMERCDTRFKMPPRIEPAFAHVKMVREIGNKTHAGQRHCGGT